MRTIVRSRLTTSRLGDLFQMHTRILTLLALILTLGTSNTWAQSLPAHLKSAPAAAIIGRILAGREQLDLKADQVARLSRLEEQLRRDRGRSVLAGLNRVPGKSVPRIKRRRTTATEALRQASALLTVEQQAKVTRLLETPGR